MAEVKATVKREEAIKKGWLQDRVLFLKPVKSNSGGLIKDPSHTGYFMWEGAKVNFVLPYDKNGRICNPFTDEDERAYFEAVTGKNLNQYDVNSWWFTKDADHDTLKVEIEKTPTFMEIGIRIDLADPVDNLKWRILKLNKNLPIYGVAESPEEAAMARHFKFMLVEDGYTDKKNSDFMGEMQKVFTYWGSIQDNAAKMHNLLYVYYITKKSTHVVPADADKEYLTEKIKNILETDRKNLLSVIEDTEYDTKVWITKAIRVGAIDKKGVNAYIIVGENVTRTLEELIEWVRTLETDQDNTWLKINESVKKMKL
jgi:hypothetical protein